MSIRFEFVSFCYFSGIRILIYGQSKTSWCETESHFENGKPRSKDIFYSADEVYLEAKAYLLGDNGIQSSFDFLLFFIKSISSSLLTTRTINIYY